MKRNAIAAVIAGSLALSGCATPTDGNVIPDNEQTLTAYAAASNACSIWDKAPSLVDVDDLGPAKRIETLKEAFTAADDAANEAARAALLDPRFQQLFDSLLARRTAIAALSINGETPAELINTVNAISNLCNAIDAMGKSNL